MIFVSRARSGSRCRPPHVPQVVGLDFAVHTRPA